jgi:hypothetical protein
MMVFLKSKIMQLRHAYLHNRKKILSLCGALILLTTFLVRDAYREYVKDLSSRIDAARTMYLLLQANERVYQEIRNFEHDSNAGSTKPIGSIFSDNLSWLDKYDEERASAAVLIDQIYGLLECVPDRTAYDGRLIDISTEMLTYEDTWKKIQDARGDASIANAKNDAIGYSRAMNKISDAITHMNGQPTKFNLETQGLASEILRAAEGISTRNAARYQKATVVSIVLYFFGWLLTVAGTLSGKPRK